MYIDSYQLIGCNRWYNCHLYIQPNYDKVDTIMRKVLLGLSLLVLTGCYQTQAAI